MLYQKNVRLIIILRIVKILKQIGRYIVGKIVNTNVCGQKNFQEALRKINFTALLLAG